MKKKLFLLFAALLAMGQNAFAYYNFSAVAPTGQTLYYKIIGDSIVSVTYPGNDDYFNYSGYSMPIGALTIPDNVTYDGTTYSVIAIDGYAFRGCYALTSVTIPNGVTSIHNRAFYSCTNLTSLTIPNTVTYIGQWAFRDCTGLTSVTIPNSVTFLESGAFYNCSSLTSVTIGNSLTYIAPFTFAFCSGLTSVTIPNSVTSIDEGAFQECSSLISVTIPNSVTSIGNSAFLSCSSLTSVTIPNSVTSISVAAFCYCSSLNTIVVETGNTHYDSRDNCNAIIQTDLNLLIQGCNSTVIPNTVTAINDCAFEGCSGLISVTIPNSVTSIGGSAFAYCTSLTSVTIPNSVTSIGGSAFEYCTSLTSVTIPNSVTSIYGYTFNRCSGLTSVNIGNSVALIEHQAFSECYNLNSVYCRPSIPPILGENIFYLHTPSKIYVSCELVSTYENALGWSNYASHIYGKPIDVDFNYSFVSDNLSFGSVSIGSLKCDDMNEPSVNVEAIPYTGNRFVGWSDGVTDNPRTVRLTSDTTIVAFFEKIPYFVTVLTNNDSWGTVTGGGTYYYYDHPTIQAYPAEHCSFLRWNDGSIANPRTLTVTGDITYTAYFESTQDITDINTADIMIYDSEGRIIVRGAEGMEVSIFDIMGREVIRSTRFNETPVLPNGVYLVKVGDYLARKIVVVR